MSDERFPPPQARLGGQKPPSADPQVAASSTHLTVSVTWTKLIVGLLAVGGTFLAFYVGLDGSLDDVIERLAKIEGALGALGVPGFDTD